MRLLRPYSLTVLLSAAVLVLGGNLAAYAATGHPLMLGRANTEGGSTTLGRSTAGAPLGLLPQPGSPPLTTSSTTRVAHLNADLVDGLDSTALQSDAYRFEPAAVHDATAVVVDLPGLPPGVYAASYSVVAKTPGGTLNCGWTRRTNHNQLEALTFGTRRFDSTTVESTTVIDTRSFAAQLTCFADRSSHDEGFAIDGPDLALSSITLIRVDELHEATAPVTARSPGRARTGH